MAVRTDASKTGLLSREADQWPRGKVIFDDPHFGDGLRGWHQLWDTNEPTGPVGLSTHPTPFGGLALMLSLSDGSGAASVANNWRDASAIKRMGIIGATKVYVEYEWAWKSLYGQNGLRCVEFGLDYCYQNGSRHFAKFRWAHYAAANRDGSGLWSRVNRWQIIDADGLPTDIPGGDWIVPYNENKANTVFSAFVFDIAAHKYDGLQFGETSIGSLAGLADADNPLRALGSPPPSTLPSFAGGMNFCFEARGRIDTTQNEASAFLTRARGEVFG